MLGFRLQMFLDNYCGGYDDEIKIRISSRELEIWKTAAESLNLTLSEYVRCVVRDSITSNLLNATKKE